jgi:Tol biopolymer transport system component
VAGRGSTPSKRAAGHGRGRLLRRRHLDTPSALSTFHGRNGRIAVALDTGSGVQVSSIRPGGQGLTQLTSVQGSAFGPDWSPDGTRIVYEVDPTGGTEGCAISLMRADGTEIRDVLTPNKGCAWDPSFTPSGHRIVFVAQRCERCGIAIRSMNRHGRDRRTILPRAPFDQVHAPRVSPGGHRVVFLAEKAITVDGVEGNRKALYMVRTNGTHLRQVVPYRLDVCACGADWAPNGNGIVSSSQAGPTPVPGKPSNLFTVRPDGTHLRYLTHSHDPAVLIYVGSYSPNGRWIAYKRVTAGEKYRLMKIHPSGRDPTLIATLEANFTGRDWGARPAT